MRHSSIDLTMNVYTDPKLLDVHGALDALPKLPLNTDPEPQPDVVQATGTDDLLSSALAPVLAPKSRKAGISGATPDKSTPDGVEEEGDQRDVISLDLVNRKEPLSIVDNGSHESGRLDLNKRPLRPEPSFKHQPSTQGIVL